MIRFYIRLALVLVLVGLGSVPTYAEDTITIPERVLGKSDAPITVEEFVSLTCSHCGEFYKDTMPTLETKYVDTGKVRFILHDYPLDGTALKAAALSRCMPADEYYPFIKTLYENQAQWMMDSNPDKILVQYARLGGLSEEKAQACLKDDKMMDAIIKGRTYADEKLDVKATPTFIINGGAETLKGAMSAEKFSEVFDRLLALKK